MIDFTTITNLYLANNEVEELYINGSKVWEKSHEPTIPNGLRFTARDGGETVRLFKNGSAPSCSFQYSTDGERTWNDLTLGTTFTLANAGDSISFRAKNAQSTLAYEWNRNHKFQLGSTGHISVDGSFYALLRQDWKTAPKSGWMGTKSFRALFSDVTGEFDITNVQPLDWTPTNDCYGGMFFYTNIVGEVPSGLLPSTTVYDYCYQAMFEGSTITNAPDLPATTLQSYCYAYMFQHCQQLTVAPTISATIAQQWHCCESMFNGDVALTTCPSLPFTRIGSQSCRYMFSGCTSLRTISMGRVEQVGSEGMAQMFYGCTSLTSFSGTLSQAYSVGASGYSRMFQGCTSLTQIPTLPTALGNLCFEHMFEGCTGLTGTIDLTQYTNIQGTGKGYGAFDYAFVGCTGITKVDLSNLTTAHGIYHEFDGCTSLVELDLSNFETVRSDSQSVFENMCNGCTSLTTVKLNKLASMGSFTTQWHNAFNGCSSLQTIYMDDTQTIPYFYDNATFTGASADFKIVVPDALYSQWIATSGWSAQGVVEHITHAPSILTFTAEQANSTVAMSAVGAAPSVSLEYSTDGSTWQDFIVGTTTVTLPNVGDNMYLRAKTTNSTFATLNNNNYNMFVMAGKIAASGSIMYLLKNDGNLDTLPSDYTFVNLFRGCSSLTTAPELPATTLAQYCYLGMFYQCTSLTTAPELPATTLLFKCYQGMFFGCSSLNSIKIGYTGNFSGTGVPTDAFYFWVSDVAASGTFYYNGSDTQSGVSAIPRGWTVQTF